MGLWSLATCPVSCVMGGVPAILRTSAYSLWSQRKGSRVNSEPGTELCIGRFSSD